MGDTAMTGLDKILEQIKADGDRQEKNDRLHALDHKFEGNVGQFYDKRQKGSRHQVTDIVFEEKKRKDKQYGTR